MKKCTYCTNTTIHFSKGIPICIECTDKKRSSGLTEAEFRATLLEDILIATANSNDASKEFDYIVSQFSGLPHPDGSQRIKNASNRLNIARKEMMKAHIRLNEYIINKKYGQ